MKFIRLRVVAVAIAGAALSTNLQGCAIDMHHGPEVTEAQTNGFKVGTATLDEVVTSLGKPSFSVVRPNGEKVIGYIRTHTRINPPSFAALIGAAPKAEYVGLENTRFVFDAESKLLRVDRAQTYALPTAPN